ncbi:MAG: PAC2 family protein [Nanoarchaeota archaeon]
MVDISLTKKPKNVTIVEGFPGFGLVGTITTEYLLQHLKCELIGTFWMEEMPATVVVHDGELVPPIGLYYNADYNLVIIHAISGTMGVEWLIADYIAEVAKQLTAKEIITIEGVGSSEESVEESHAFYYATNPKKKEQLKKIGVTPLKEGIIIGVTSALLLKTKVDTIALFADTHSKLPDSKAAAKIIEVLDKYLGLKIDPKPLVETAQKFEKKLQELIEKSKVTTEQVKEKQMNYVG